VAYDIDRQAAGSGDGAPPPADALIERALNSADAHALKLTEAVLRCHARTKEPALLHAAADASERLRD
jgi:hypothetical protein